MTTRDTAAEPRTANRPHAPHGLPSPDGRFLWDDTDGHWEPKESWVEAEAASGPALTTADVARALIESDLIPRYMEYARLSPSMNPAETIEHVAATWAPFVLARLAPAAAVDAPPLATAEERVALWRQWGVALRRAGVNVSLHEERRGFHRVRTDLNDDETGQVVWKALRLRALTPAAAEPAEAPTIRDLIEWVEDEGHNANAADEIQIWYRAYLAAHPAPRGEA